MANKRAYEYGQQLGVFTLIKPSSEMTDEDKASAKGVKPGARGWLLQCQCGTFILAEPARVVRGFLQSCGCLRGANISKNRDHERMGQSIKASYAAKLQEEKELERKKNSQRQQNYWKHNKEEKLNKLKETFKAKHGVENPFQLKTFKDSRIKSGEVYYIAETGETVSEWFKRTNPEFSYQHLKRACWELDTNRVPEKYLQTINDNYKNHISSLEVFATENLPVKKRPYKAAKEVKYRFDFEIKEGVYLNVDGLYWHSEDRVGKNYHFEMREACEKAGIRVLQIRENEVKTKTAVVKSMINNILNKDLTVVFARKCKVLPVNKIDAQKFFKENHLMGDYYNGTCIGLYYEEKLVSCMLYKKLSKHKLDIIRFCSKLNYRVVGAITKLLSAIEKANPETKAIEYWVDLRYGTGNSLLNLGFKHEKDILTYELTDKYDVFHSKSQKAKQKSVKKIYNAGQRLYVKYL
jgi:hypothetical protein